MTPLAAIRASSATRAGTIMKAPTKESFESSNVPRGIGRVSQNASVPTSGSS